MITGYPEVEEKYEIIKLIAKSILSRVYKARNRETKAFTALKLLHFPEDNYKEFSRRFEREVSSIIKIHHPNVVRIQEAGLLGECHYIAMEYISGTNLKKVAQKNNPLSISFIHKTITQSVQGIFAAHVNNIIHRDIKPTNILISKQKVVKITDFGVAKDLDCQALTQTGTVLGTPGYIAPEQSRGDRIDKRSDIYSLGITLYFLLTGATPFQGKTAIDIMLKSLESHIPDPRDLRKDAPLYMCELVKKMTQKEPIDRYQSLREVLDILHKNAK